MEVTLRVLAILELIVLLVRLPRIPGAITRLAQQLGAAPMLVGAFTAAVLLASAWGSIQLWRLQRSGLLINRVLAAVSIPLVVAKYWGGEWGTPTRAGVAILGQVAVAAILFSPAAGRACGSRVGVGSGELGASEPAA